MEYMIIDDYLLTKLQKVQNASARLEMACSKYTTSKSILKKLHWLPIRERIKFSLILQVYKGLNGLSPPYITDMLSYETTLRMTRSSQQSLLKVPKWNNITCGKRSFEVAGPTEWNTIPINIRTQENVKKFKTELKTHIFNQVYECDK